MNNKIFAEIKKWISLNAGLLKKSLLYIGIPFAIFVVSIIFIANLGGISGYSLTSYSANGKVLVSLQPNISNIILGSVFFVFLPVIVSLIAISRKSMGFKTAALVVNLMAVIIMTISINPTGNVSCGMMRSGGGRRVATAGNESSSRAEYSSCTQQTCAYCTGACSDGSGMMYDLCTECANGDGDACTKFNNCEQQAEDGTGVCYTNALAGICLDSCFKEGNSGICNQICAQAPDSLPCTCQTDSTPQECKCYTDPTAAGCNGSPLPYNTDCPASNELIQLIAQDPRPLDFGDKLAQLQKEIKHCPISDNQIDYGQYCGKIEEGIKELKKVTSLFPVWIGETPGVIDSIVDSPAPTSMIAKSSFGITPYISRTLNFLEYGIGATVMERENGPDEWIPDISVLKGYGVDKTPEPITFTPTAQSAKIPAATYIRNIIWNFTPNSGGSAAVDAESVTCGSDAFTGLTVTNEANNIAYVIAVFKPWVRKTVVLTDDAKYDPNKLFFKTVGVSKTGTALNINPNSFVNMDRVESLDKFPAIAVPFGPGDCNVLNDASIGNTTKLIKITDNNPNKHPQTDGVTTESFGNNKLVKEPGNPFGEQAVIHKDIVYAEGPSIPAISESNYYPPCVGLNPIASPSGKNVKLGFTWDIETLMGTCWNCLVANPATGQPTHDLCKPVLDYVKTDKDSTSKYMVRNVYYEHVVKKSGALGMGSVCANPSQLTNANQKGYYFDSNLIYKAGDMYTSLAFDIDYWQHGDCADNGLDDSGTLDDDPAFSVIPDPNGMEIGGKYEVDGITIGGAQVNTAQGPEGNNYVLTHIGFDIHSTGIQEESTCGLKITETHKRALSPIDYRDPALSLLEYLAHVYLARQELSKSAYINGQLTTTVSSSGSSGDSSVNYTGRAIFDYLNANADEGHIKKNFTGQLRPLRTTNLSSSSSEGTFLFDSGNAKCLRKIVNYVKAKDATAKANTQLMASKLMTSTDLNMSDVNGEGFVLAGLYIAVKIDSKIEIIRTMDWSEDINETTLDDLASKMKITSVNNGGCYIGKTKAGFRKVKITEQDRFKSCRKNFGAQKAGSTTGEYDTDSFTCKPEDVNE